MIRFIIASFSVVFGALVFLPMLMMLLVILYALKPNHEPPEEDWDSILAEGN